MGCGFAKFAEGELGRIAATPGVLLVLAKWGSTLDANSFQRIRPSSCLFALNVAGCGESH